MEDHLYLRILVHLHHHVYSIGIYLIIDILVFYKQLYIHLHNGKCHINLEIQYNKVLENG